MFEVKKIHQSTIFPLIPTILTRSAHGRSSHVLKEEKKFPNVRELRSNNNQSDTIRKKLQRNCQLGLGDQALNKLKKFQRGSQFW